MTSKRRGGCLAPDAGRSNRGLAALRAILAVIGFLLVGILYFLLSTYLLPVFASVLIVLLPVVAIISLIFLRKARCPGCPKVMWMFPSEIRRCRTCDKYLQLRKDGPEWVEPGFIAETPEFSAPFDFLNSPKEWTWPWGENCCVCGNAAKRRETYPIAIIHEFVKGGQHMSPGGVVNLSHTEVMNVDVPYCSEHKNGIDVGKENIGMGVISQTMKFRSLDYCKEFRSANDKG